MRCSNRITNFSPINSLLMGLCYAGCMDEPTPAGIPAPILKNPKAIDLYTVAVWALAAIGVLSVIGAMALAVFGRWLALPWARWPLCWGARMKTSDDYRPCVAIYPNGRTMRTNVRHIRMDTVQTAVAKLATDRTAWVEPDAVEDVMTAWSDAKRQRAAHIS